MFIGTIHMANELKKRLEKALLENELITLKELDDITASMNVSGKGFVDLLLDGGFVAKDSLNDVLYKEFHISFYDLSEFVVNEEANALIDETVAIENMLLPIKIHNGRLTVAMANPFDIYILDKIKAKTGLGITPVLATVKQIRNCINNVYSPLKARTLAKTAYEANPDEDILRDPEIDDSPTVKLADTILSQAVSMRASDIHIEPFDNYLRIRFRIDGQLIKINELDIKVLDILSSRIKILGRMDTSERRLPQDGHFKKLINDISVDLRISTMPTVYGEKVVIRLIYLESISYNKAELGFFKEDLEKIDRIFKNRHGMILVTGPTGSGKTTTLGSFIAELNDMSVNIITVEDPVENHIDGVNQVSLNQKIGLTFSESLKYMLRQDPDIIMIGEIRDRQTAELALRASITGHLVLSTLHTNDAVSTVSRLIGMGIEDFLLASVIRGIISQRLVRKICPHCKYETNLSLDQSIALGLPCDTVVFKGKGCVLCNHTGYFGRLAVIEVLEADFYVKNLIAEGASEEEIFEYALKNGMTPMWDNALRNVMEGNTTVEEIYKNIFKSK